MSNDIIVPGPVPVAVVPPGLRVKVHIPDEGKPLNSTLPVETVQVGWIIESIVGADGAPGATLTVKVVADEIQPSTVVVTSYFPAVNPVNCPVALLCDPTTGSVPVTVYETPTPLAGEVIVIIPVGMLQDGCVVTEAVGADGVAGGALITILVEDGDIQVEAFVTV